MNNRNYDCIIIISVISGLFITTCDYLVQMLCSIVGREDEPTIRNNQHLWNNYFQKVSFHQLPGGHVLITKYHAELAKLIMNYIELHV